MPYSVDSAERWGQDLSHASDTPANVFVQGTQAAVYALNRLIREPDRFVDGFEVKPVKDENFVEKYVPQHFERNKFVPPFVRNSLLRNVTVWNVLENNFTYFYPPSSGREDDDAIGGEISDRRRNDDGVSRRMDVTFTVICDYKDYMHDRHHVALLRTLLFSLDAVHRLRDLVHGGESASMPKLPRKITVTCILLPHQRKLPVNGGDIHPEHVNAGVTATLTHDVLVYRKQHMHKVLIHEIIHCCGVDSALGASPSRVFAEKNVMHSLGYSSDTGFLQGGEAFVEVLACYWHMFLVLPLEIAGEIAKSRQADDGMVPGSEESIAYRALGRMWKKERRLYVATCAKLLRHYAHSSRAPSSYIVGGKNALSRSRPNVVLLPSLSGVFEHTSVLSYFFGKTAFWDRLADIPAWPDGSGSADRFWDLYEKSLAGQESLPMWSEITAAAFRASNRGVSRSERVSDVDPGGRPVLMTSLSP